MAEAKMSREQVLEIPTLKRQLVTNRELASRYGVSMTTIAYWTKRLKERGEVWERVRKGGRKPILSE